MELDKSIVNQDAWTSLKKLTSARIALGRTGTAEPLKASLAFKLAHAHARDAIYSHLDKDALIKGMLTFRLPAHTLKSKASDRTVYLQRPDLGRTLDDSSTAELKN